MKQWEYCSLILKPDENYDYKQEIVFILHKIDGDIKEVWYSGEIQGTDITNSIALLGTRGWEIIWRNDLDNQSILYFFKRKKNG